MRSAPVVAALEAYRQHTTEYPEDLSVLVPQFLDAAALRLPPDEQESYPLEYARTKASYELSFRYVGPGMNRCTYTPDAASWRCDGYF